MGKLFKIAGLLFTVGAFMSQVNVSTATSNISTWIPSYISPEWIYSPNADNIWLYTCLTLAIIMFLPPYLWHLPLGRRATPQNNLLAMLMGQKKFLERRREFVLKSRNENTRQSLIKWYEKMSFQGMYFNKILGFDDSKISYEQQLQLHEFIPEAQDFITFIKNESGRGNLRKQKIHHISGLYLDRINKVLEKLDLLIATLK